MFRIESIEMAMNINPNTGVSVWWDIAQLESIVGFPLRGNGSPFFQSDRGLGKKYMLEKQRDKGNTLSSIRTIGFAYHHQTHRASGIPLEVKRWLSSGLPCAMCGTTTNIIADHKDGNKEPLPSPNIHDFQPLCYHCNTVKREVCKRCSEDSVRFDAKSLGYCISWVVGIDKFQPKYPRCLGCYWYSPVEFRKMLIKKNWNKL
jgi:hypothetical protein